MVGGTGFYIQALLYDIDFEAEEDNTEIRSLLEQTAKEKGVHFLHEQLKAVDPVAAEEIHENNVKRVIRALEFYQLNGFPISQHNQEQREKETEKTLEEKQRRIIIDEIN